MNVYFGIEKPRGRRNSRRHATRPIFRGVTLIEVTLAILLGTFLMLVVFQAFYVSARFRMVASETHSQGLSLTNCMRDLSSDLIGHEIKPGSKIRQETNQPEVLDNSLLPKLTFQDSFAVGSHTHWVSFVGEKNYCALQTNTSHPRFDELPDNVIRAGNSLVVWWFYQGTVPRVEGWISKDLRIAKDLQLPPNAKGLIRTQICLDSKGKEVQLSRVINPDVSSIEFHYSDGKTTQPRWESQQTREPPNAVVVRVTMNNRIHEHWIPIPTAERN